MGPCFFYAAAATAAAAAAAAAAAEQHGSRPRKTHKHRFFRLRYVCMFTCLYVCGMCI
jgi:hypothetical protein